MPSCIVHLKYLEMQKHMFQTDLDGPGSTACHACTMFAYLQDREQREAEAVGFNIGLLNESKRGYRDYKGITG